MAVGEDINGIEDVSEDAVCDKRDAVSGEENAAELLLIVLLEGIAVSEDIDDVEVVK